MSGYPGQIHTATPAFPSSHNAPPQHGGAVGGPPSAAVPDSYFTESRKGEVNELRNLLRNFSTERDPQRKRDIIKKVIAYMTLGIDVSRLFTEMMLAIETRDLVIKKMVYLYLCNYAQTHPELAQMCTNTLQKDCGNEDPMVRGLALRALCSLNLPQMVEYISEPLRKSLNDHHAYVRKTGVMGILKLFYLDKDAFQECNFVDILYDMLRDPDASVVANCIVVLNEVMSKTPQGGMAINRAIMLHLLNRIHEFSEFSVVQVLELVPRYIPANEEEGFQIMNLLDPLLRTSSAAAVMATIRAFLSLSDHMGDTDPMQLKRQVAERVKAPLVTLLASGSSELVYCLLKQMDALVELCPGIFDDEYRQMYIRHHEPTNVKYVKIQLLAKLVNPNTAPDIVAELAELVYDQNAYLGRLAVRSMGVIACRNTGGPGCAESIAQRLVDLLDSTVQHIQSEAATALTLLMRKHPALKPLVAVPLARTVRYIQEPTGKASVLYLIGECGDLVPEAPYVLEKMIDSYENIKDVNIKLALLQATMRLFFARPPETQRMLGRLLAAATDDVSSQDLHDRALLYYRLLKCGADPGSVLQNVIKTETTIADGITFAEENDLEWKKELMQEFNTLAIIYGKGSVNFISKEFQITYEKMPKEHPLTDANVTPVGPTPTTEIANAQTHETVVANEAAATNTATAADMGGIADLLGFDSPAAAPAPTPTPAPASQANNNNRIVLAPSVTMTGEDYQNQWGAIGDGQAIVTTVILPATPNGTDPIEQALSRNNIFTMASGELPTELKFFLYAQDQPTGSLVLIQSNVSKQDEPLMILTIKVVNKSTLTDQQIVDQLTELLQAALG